MTRYRATGISVDRNDFNKKTYSLTSANCVDFLLSVVQAAGLKAPARARLQTPDDFVRQVRALN
jgi:hypothetical protein